MAKKRTEVPKKGAAEWMVTYSDMVTVLLCLFVLLFAMSLVDVERFQMIAASLAGRPVNLVDTSGGSNSIMQMMGSGIMDMPSLRVDPNASETDQTPNDELRIDDRALAAVAAQDELIQIASDLESYFSMDPGSGSDVSPPSEPGRGPGEGFDFFVGNHFIEITLPGEYLFDSGSDALKPQVREFLALLGEKLHEFPDSDIVIEGHTDSQPINTLRFPSNDHLSASRAISVAQFLRDEMQVNPLRISHRGRGEWHPIAPNDTPEGRAQNRRVVIRVFSAFYSDDIMDDILE
jgi:chemotaxis protein MotB